MKAKTIISLILGLMILLSFSITTGSDKFGSITGTVIDIDTGDPIPGASIHVIGTTVDAMTDQDGKFTILNLSPGKYTLKMTAVSYETKEIKAVNILANQATEITIVLKVNISDLDKVIKVTANRTIIDKYNISSSKPQIGIPKPVAEDEIHGGRTGNTVMNGMPSPVPPSANYQSMNVMPQPKKRPYCPPPPYPHQWRREYDDMFFKEHGTNPFVDTEDDHLSTFAIDVDEASFNMTRSYLDRGQLPPEEAIRTEEFINHFKYDYAHPYDGPFAINVEGAPSIFGDNSRILRIGIQGKELFEEERKPSNLVFIIDVSGSMARENRLGLVKKSLTSLVDNLREDDRVGIVIYGTNARTVLEFTSVEDKHRILKAIKSLYPEGSTNAEAGLRRGYQIAERNFDKYKNNRIILCSDGVANVGLTDPDDLLKMIKRQANRGITLTTVGFGMGNYNDELMEKLGNKGNGMYAYVDSYKESKKVFLENLNGMLQVIASDVKIQVDFNPETVRSYRLIGYENREVADQKFRDDREDGGEIGAGHQVTALYEVKFKKQVRNSQIATVFVRFKNPGNNEVDEIALVVSRNDFHDTFWKSSHNLKLAAAAAEFGEIMGDSYWAKNGDLSRVYDLVRKTGRKRVNEQTHEFIRMIEKAMHLQDALAEY